MTPSLLSGAIVCPVRFIHLALFAALVATTSPFAADTRPVEVGDDPTASRLVGATASAVVDDVPRDFTGREGRQPSPERVPAPLPFVPQPERRSPRGSALNRITILH